MPKQPPIRIRGKDKELIKQLNKAVSNKKYDLKSRYHLNVGVQTERISTFKHRKDLNQYISEMQRFLAADFEEEKAPIKELRKEVGRINRLKKRELKIRENLTLPGGKTLKRAAEYGDERLHRFEPLTINMKDFRTIAEMKEYTEELKEEFKGNFIKTQDEAYKENYLKALKKVMGDSPALEADYLRLKKHLEQMDINTYMNYYYTKNFTKLGFIYDDFHANDILTTLLDEWDTPEPEREEPPLEKKKRRREKGRTKK